MSSTNDHRLAVLLIICKQKDVYYIANDSSSNPGVLFSPKAGPNNPAAFVDQINSLTQNILLKNPLIHPLEWLQVAIGEVEIIEDATKPLAVKAPLYLIQTPQINDTIELKESYQWETMPTLLRSMTKDRKRLPYLRAFEYLQGTTKSQIKVLDKIPL